MNCVVDVSYLDKQKVVFSDSTFVELQIVPVSKNKGEVNILKTNNQTMSEIVDNGQVIMINLSGDIFSVGKDFLCFR